MWHFLRDRASSSTFPPALREQLDGEPVVVADRVGVVAHLRGHVPGVSSATSVARFRGAFAVTPTRVITALATAGDPRLRVIDSPWDLGRGPAQVTIGPRGVRIDIGLRGVDPGFSGSMTLNYKRAIADELLAQLPAPQLWCGIDPAAVYRVAGVRPHP